MIVMKRTLTMNVQNVGDPNPILYWMLSLNKKSGVCQNAHKMPKIRLETRAFHLDCSRFRA